MYYGTSVHNDVYATPGYAVTRTQEGPDVVFRLTPVAVGKKSE